MPRDMSAAQPEGELRGVRTRGCVEIDLAWVGSRVIGANFRSKPGGVALRQAGLVATMSLDNKGRAQSRPGTQA